MANHGPDSSRRYNNIGRHSSRRETPRFITAMVKNYGPNWPFCILRFKLRTVRRIVRAVPGVTGFSGSPGVRNGAGVSDPPGVGTCLPVVSKYFSLGKLFCFARDNVPDGRRPCAIRIKLSVPFQTPLPVICSVYTAQPKGPSNRQRRPMHHRSLRLQ